KLSNAIAFGLLVSVSAIGCKTKTPYITRLPNSGGGAHASSDSTPGQGLTADADKPTSNALGSTALSDPGARKDWPRDHEIFKSDTVHFDYDSSVIKDAEKSKVSAVADYIKEHSADAVEIEGYCDERGT